MPNHLLSKRAFLHTFIVAAIVVACLIATPARADLGEELFKLTASDAAPFDLFGWSVAISGNTSIIGSYGNDIAGSSSGAAYLFDTTTGQQLTKLIGGDSRASDFFGWSVAISANIAIVGARAHNNSAGSAYLFDVTTGQELFRLTASDVARDDRFGTSVAISGNIAIVGAVGNDDAGADSGSAYLFDVTTGRQLLKLTASDAGEVDQFGYSVAISGNIAIVGAVGNDDAGADSGSAYLFDVTTGQELFKLTSDAAQYRFGESVGIDGSVAIVGLYGAAYLFDVATGTQLFKLAASDAPAGQVQGVGISGNIAIVGFPATGLVQTSPGVAYLFDVTTGGQLAKLTGSDTAPNDVFGSSVGVSGNVAIVGAWGATDSAGAAYQFSTVPEPQSLALLALGLPLLFLRNALRNTERRIP